MLDGELVKFWEKSFGIKLWQFMLFGLTLSAAGIVGIAFLVKWVIS